MKLFECKLVRPLTEHGGAAISPWGEVLKVKLGPYDFGELATVGPRVMVGKCGDRWLVMAAENRPAAKPLPQRIKVPVAIHRIGSQAGALK